MSAPLPIFVLGLQRSGTTWAANLLAATQEAARIFEAIQTVLHRSWNNSGCLRSTFLPLAF